MEIYIQKIGLIRPNLNPKNLSLNLDIDWTVEYTNTDQNKINFDMILKSSENFKLNFKIEGIVVLELFEEFIHEDVSQIIFNHACKALMDMISITKESSHIGVDSNIGSENIPNTIYN